ncbi:MAG: hydantoinase B/oxoprolinase family protein, partial [Dehalococcoidia bacterium]|nr:hydantoinase B/oxoprolinase family protein [Dehalococcoidia bacterium]
EAIFKALQEALPEKVTAAWERTLGLRTTGWDPRRGRPYHDVNFIAGRGGGGGTYGADGYDHIGSIVTAGGLITQDYEMYELADPHHLILHEYWTDSAGAGRWRGGLGVKTVCRLEGDDTLVVVSGDEEGASGLLGGKSGTPNKLALVYPDGRRQEVHPWDIVPHIPKGTVYMLDAGGGGGFGDPHERLAEKVLDDVRKGVVSSVKAREDYGVVVDPDTFELDEELTAALRAGEGLVKAQ